MIKSSTPTLKAFAILDSVSIDGIKNYGFSKCRKIRPSESFGGEASSRGGQAISGQKGRGVWGEFRLNKRIISKLSLLATESAASQFKHMLLDSLKNNPVANQAYARLIL